MWVSYVLVMVAAVVVDMARSGVKLFHGQPVMSVLESAGQASSAY